MPRPQAREVKKADASKAVADSMKKKVTHGVKAGLLPDETRITCIFKDSQNQLLHDWSRTTEQSFKDICLAMADLYIEQVIAKAAADGAKVKRSIKAEPPEQYIDLYEDDQPNVYAKYLHKRE